MERSMIKSLENARDELIHERARIELLYYSALTARASILTRLAVAVLVTSSGIAILFFQYQRSFTIDEDTLILYASGVLLLVGGLIWTLHLLDTENRYISFIKLTQKFLIDSDREITEAGELVHNSHPLKVR